jgi:hypothetical protein
MARIGDPLLEFGRGQAKQPARDDELLDLLGALEDVEDLGVPCPFLQQRLLVALPIEASLELGILLSACHAERTVSR